MTTEREIPITPAQAQLLRRLNAQMKAAESQIALALDAILAGHNLTSNHAAGLGGTDEAPTITLKHREVSARERATTSAPIAEL